MFRALAGYFFGGPQDELPQVECETKEVNDWLVVNMPDQPSDAVDLDENDDPTNPPMDLDDALWCLSNWFAAPAVIEPTTTDDEDDVLEIPAQQPSIQLLYDTSSCSGNKENSSFCFDFGHFQYSKIVDQLHKRCFTTPLLSKIPAALMPSSGKEVVACSNQLQKSKEQQLQLQKSKELLQRLRERNANAAKKALKSSDVTTCHPVYSKTYVNHRNPAISPPKTDLLQKIKELEPEQRAAQNATRKDLSRRQINRQNKNYIYDTSTKKNRRKNLQRNPSGANNNRKCCY